VLKAIGEALDPTVSVTLVSPVSVQVYSGMVPGFVAGHYGLAECGVDLGPLAAKARALVARSAGALISTGRREVILANGESVPYDLLSIDIGSRPLVGDVIGVERHAVPVRPLETFVTAWEETLARARRGAVQSVSVVGGGAAGLEIAFAMDHRFRAELGARAPHVRVLTDQPDVLMEYGPGVRERLKRLARKRNVGLHPMSRVAEVGPDFVRLKDNLQFASDATFWVAGAGAHTLFRDSGLETDERGFLLVDDFMQSVSHPDILAAGDCATSRDNPRPKAGVFAVRAGPALAFNLRAKLTGQPLRDHVTRRRFLALISCGDRRAVGVYGPLSFEGRWVWAWKDRIDRAFLARYRADEES
ncbi:MAG TPA: FAD-dependent oxidoreductase, partial [Usitatibacteraceae bacterium]|nr:FAD-dependent oxidoreductase [Usitatibacteraceae bacterium]